MCSKRRSKQLNKHACRLDKERSCSEKHYVKFMMRTMLISLSVGVYMHVPVQATTQTIKGSHDPPSPPQLLIPLSLLLILSLMQMENSYFLH